MAKIKTPVKGPLAVSYIRYSTPEQSRGGSYRRQLESTEAYCKKKGLTLRKENSYFDKGVSAYHGKNKTKGELKNLLDDVKSGAVPCGSYLIVESLDRLGRDSVISQLEFLLGLLKAGIIVVTLGQNEQEYSSGSTKDTGALIQAIFSMARANEESEVKSMRLSSAWSAKRKKIGSQPLTSITPGWIETKNNKIIAIPRRAEVVREIFDLCLKGYGRRAIAKILNERNEPVWSSKIRNPEKFWRDTYIGKILSNRSVFGEFQPHTKTGGIRQPVGELYPHYYPEVVSKEVFNAASHKIEQRSNKGGRGVCKASNLFSGRMRCLVCGGPMHYVDKGNNDKYVRCELKALGKGQCASNPIKYSTVEQLILRELVEIDWLALIRGTTAAGTELTEEQEKTALEVELKETTRKIENLVDVLADGTTLYDSVRGKLASLEDRRNSLKKQYQELTKILNRRTREKDRSFEAFIALEGHIHLAADIGMRTVLKSVVTDILSQSSVGNSRNGIEAVLLFNGGGKAYLHYEGDDERMALRSSDFPSVSDFDSVIALRMS